MENESFLMQRRKLLNIGLYLCYKEGTKSDFAFIIIIFISMFNYWFTTVIRVHQILFLFIIFVSSDVKIMKCFDAWMTVLDVSI